MNEVQKEINNAYVILSAVSVSGDAVDAVAACKTALRCAFRKAEDRPPEQGETGEE